MLQPHGHYEKGRLNAPDILRAVALAQAGAWVLMYDMVGYNDHLGLNHQGEEPAEWHHWGFSRAGLQTWNSLCVFEWLARQPQVDAKRIGCSGISGGGTQTFLLAAVEPRLACAAPVKMVSSTMQGGCICENPPLLRLFACNPEIVALCAPRPLLLISDSGDWTADNPEWVAPFLRKVYALYGVPERFQHVNLSEGHQFGKQAREAYYRWSAEVLQLPTVPRDPAVDPEELIPFLRVWGEQMPRPQAVPEGEALFERYRAAAQDGQHRWRRSRRFRSEALDALLSMLGLAETPAADAATVPTTISAYNGSNLLPQQVEKGSRWLVVVADEANRARLEQQARRGERVWFFPSMRAPLPPQRPTFFDTYNLMPTAVAARALLESLQVLRAQGARARLLADGSGAAIAGIVAALLNVPCQLEPANEVVDLPGWARIGGFETLCVLLPSRSKALSLGIE
jgi:hypothetical protein